MSYVLGVDLGTSYTAAATVSDGDTPAMVGLGNRATQVPSVVYVRPDDVVVGELAEQRSAEDAARVVREFKGRVGDRVPIWVGGRRFTAEELLTEMLRWVLDQTTERMGAAPDRIALTHPANWS